MKINQIDYMQLQLAVPPLKTVNGRLAIGVTASAAIRGLCSDSKVPAAEIRNVPAKTGSAAGGRNCHRDLCARMSDPSFRPITWIRSIS